MLNKKNLLNRFAVKEIITHMTLFVNAVTYLAYSVARLSLMILTFI